MLEPIVINPNGTSRCMSLKEALMLLSEPTAIYVPLRARTPDAAGIVASYESGMSLHGIERKYHHSHRRIMGILREAGVEIRPPIKAPEPDAATRRQMVADHRAGDAPYTIARRYGYGIRVTRDVLRAAAGRLPRARYNRAEVEARIKGGERTATIAADLSVSIRTISRIRTEMDRAEA